MTIVSHAAAPRRFHLGSAQLNALLRWHGAAKQGDLLPLLDRQPHFPVIETGGTPAKPRRHYTRPRHPQGGPDHAA